MTDELPMPTPDELLEDTARKVAHMPPTPIPDAQGLPDDVRDGLVEDEGESHPSVGQDVIAVEDPE